MDQENLDLEEPLHIMRHRNPTFSKDEIRTLVNLIAKHSSVVNSKLTNSVAIELKEFTWSKIAKMFNAQGFKHHRKVNCLKIKWHNLKKDARKVTKNLMDIQSDLDELTRQIVSMIMSEENNLNEISTKDLEDENHEDQKDSKGKDDKYWDDDDNEKKDKTDPDNQSKNKYRRFSRRLNRSINFTPQECKLLLQCVRREKKYIFSKGCTGRILALKQQAWARITNMFNKHSPHKRTTTMLRHKWNNMRNLARHNTPYLHKSNKPGDEDCTQFENDEDNERIKKEPDDDEAVNENESDDQDDLASDHERIGENSFDALRGTSDQDQVDLEPDPLSTVLNGDSGLGSISLDGFNSENSEVTKLKLELLKWQLENAKLERKRIEDAAAADAKLSEARATETALRLRAARLHATAAAARLPLAHPALYFPREEERARQYMDQYHPTYMVSTNSSGQSEVKIYSK